jgi:hypothetical protein
MILQPHETKRFYRIWFAMLSYANRQLKLVRELPESPQDGSIDVQDAFKIASAVWDDDALRYSFIEENPTGLPPEDLALARSWDRRVAGDFYIFRFLKKYTVLIGSGDPAPVYGVLGLVSPIEEVLPGPLPRLARMTLLPFEGRITYDGLMAPYSVYFGSGIRGNLNDIYRLANERGAIVTSLEPQATAGPQQTPVEIAKRNDKLITAFRRDLAQSSLSMKMIAQHAENIETFGRSYLLSQAPARGLIDLTSADISAYLTQAGLPATARKTVITSFKRFIRFLYDTGRIDDSRARQIMDLLK